LASCEYAEICCGHARRSKPGFTLVRDFTAPMIHAHRRTFGYEFRRGLLDARVMDEAFGFRLQSAAQTQPCAVAGRAGNSRRGGGEALKTWTAHALARGVYRAYRWLLRPLGLGPREAVEDHTRNLSQESAES